MQKKYPASKFFKILTLGIKRYGAKINNNILHIYYNFIGTLSIKHIASIKYVYKIGTKTPPGYIISLYNHKKVIIPYSLMEGYTMKELLVDLRQVNPTIKYDERTLKLANSNCNQKYKLKFNFTPPKGKHLKNDAEFIQRYPSLDFAVVLPGLLMLIAGPLLFAFFGSKILLALHGHMFAEYRIILLVLSAFPLSFTIWNISAALISQYLGHKVTIICLAISIAFIAIGLF